jgi:hypothetical protein
MVAPRSSPTDRPPIAYPSKPSSTVRRALSARSARSVPPWTMPNWLRSGRSWATNALRARPAHSAVRSTAERTIRSGEGSGGHTSSTIWMSLPSRTWMSTAPSGLRWWRLPS